MNNWTNETTDALASIIGEATDIAPAEDSPLTGPGNTHPEGLASLIDNDDACCTAPPTDYEMKQAYANSAIGMQAAGVNPACDGTCHEKMFAEQKADQARYHEESRRNQALAMAVQYATGDDSPSDIVNAAQTFLAFLKGA